MKLVIQNSARELRGNERQAAALAQGLLARGHEVTVSCRCHGPLDAHLQAVGVPTTGVRPRGDADLWAAHRFASWLRRERPDILLLTSWKSAFWGGWAGRRAGVPRVIQRLGVVRVLPRGLKGWKYRRAFRRHVDAMIVNSPEVGARWLESAPWFPASAVHMVYNGIAAPPGAIGSGIREELGVAPQVPLLVAAGEFQERKGFEVLLEALRQLPIPEARLVLLGRGQLEQELRRRAEALGVAGRVHWLGYRADALQVFAGCDVFVLSSRNDSLSNAMLEAMGVGTLVVATETAGVADALAAREGRPPAGWMVPPADAAALAAGLAAALEALRQHPQEARQRAAEARYRVEHWFSVERMVEEYERVLLACLSGKTPAPR